MPLSETLKREQVSFEPSSVADPHGRVFRWSGRLYRAINHEAAPIYRRLLDDPRCSRLFDVGLIDTGVADFDLEGYGLVLCHRELPRVTYGFEWCAPMLLDAAKLTIDLAIELDKLGFELLDAHPWNVLFEGTAPRFIDFGSIKPAEPNTPWIAQGEFVKTFINPLFLLVRGFGGEARHHMVQTRKWGVTGRDLAQALGVKARLTRFWLGLTMLPRENEPRSKALVKLKDYLNQIELPAPATEWSDYYNEYASLDAPDTWTAKQRVADDVLRRVKPKTVLDLAANAGWFSRLAERHGCQVVATDNDETCLAELYRNAKADGLDILPVVQDFTRPSPAHGAKSEFPDAYTRLRSDLVLALAITHHLVFKAGMDFDQIAETLAGFTGQELLVEFVPKEDRHVAEWYTDQYAWYTLDNFKAALSKHFDGVSVTASNVVPRVLLSCRVRCVGEQSKAA